MPSKLDILNSMLAVNGEAPVSAITSTDPAAIQALNKLNKLDKSLQSRGWFFNKETITVTANTQGEVVLPQNTLSADPVDNQLDYVKRGSRLYDRENNTYEIGEDVKCFLILQLDISETPESYGDYLEAKAAQEYYTDDDGDEAKINRLQDRERESYAYFRKEDIRNTDTNIRRSPMGARLLRETSPKAYYKEK